jgi:hypothetical protein
MQRVVTLPTDSDGLRLTAEEVEALCNFTFRIHDHNATQSAQAIFWWRSDGDDLYKFWN